MIAGINCPGGHPWKKTSSGAMAELAQVGAMKDQHPEQRPAAVEVLVPWFSEKVLPENARTHGEHTAHSIRGPALVLGG